MTRICSSMQGIFCPCHNTAKTQTTFDSDLSVVPCAQVSSTGARSCLSTEPHSLEIYHLSTMMAVLFSLANAAGSQFERLPRLVSSSILSKSLMSAVSFWRASSSLPPITSQNAQWHSSHCVTRLTGGNLFPKLSPDHYEPSPNTPQ